VKEERTSVSTRTEAEAIPRGDAASEEAEGGTFRALRHRNYRLLWTGQIGHSASQWMEQVIRPVLVYELTGSAFWVSFLVFMRMLPVLCFGIIAGVVADRYDRRKVLMATQFVTMACHLVLAFLVLTGVVEVWQVFVTALFSGGAMAFNQPARQSLIPMMVPREDLMNAVALNTAAMNLMRIGGGALAGLLLISFSIGGIYLLNGLIYTGVIVSTFMMSFPKPERTRERKSFGGDFLEGFAYIKTNKPVLCLVLVALVMYVFGMPYQQVFVPLLALNEFQLDRSWVGWMLSATGLGAICGSLFVASRGRYKRPSLALLLNLSVFSGCLIWLGLSRWLPLTLVGLALAGSMSVSYMAVTNTLLLTATPPELHGRVLSLLSLDRGIIPVGAIFAGVISESFSTSAGLVTMGTLMLLFTGIVFLLLGPTLSKLQLGEVRVRRVRHG